MKIANKNSTTTTTRTNDSRFWRVAVIPSVAALFSSLFLALAWGFRLPKDVAMKWANGSVESVEPLSVAILSTLGPALGALIFLIVLRLGGKLGDWGRRSTVGALVALSLFLSGSLPALLTPTLLVTDPWLAPDPGIMSVAVLGFGAVLLGTLAGFLSKSPASNTNSDVPNGHSGAATVLWSTTITAWSFVALAASGTVLLILGAASITPWPASLMGGVIAVCAVGLSRWTIQVDDIGLTCRPIWGPGSVIVPAEEGATASTGRASGGLDFLALGIKGLSTTAPQLRFHLGETLLITRADGGTASVSVKDPGRAADAYNAAVRRIQQTRP